MRWLLRLSIFTIIGIMVAGSSITRPDARGRTGGSIIGPRGSNRHNWMGSSRVNPLGFKNVNNMKQKQQPATDVKRLKNISKPSSQRTLRRCKRTYKDPQKYPRPVVSETYKFTDGKDGQFYNKPDKGPYLEAARELLDEFKKDGYVMAAGDRFERKGSSVRMDRQNRFKGEGENKDRYFVNIQFQINNTEKTKAKDKAKKTTVGGVVILENDWVNLHNSNEKAEMFYNAMTESFTKGKMIVITPPKINC